jgi:hypothetical protein
MKTTVTVTLDGRILVQQGRNSVELVAPLDTLSLRNMLAEAACVQQAIWPAPQPAAQSEEAQP